MSNTHRSKPDSSRVILINLCIVTFVILIVTTALVIEITKKIKYIKNHQNVELLQLKADLINGKGFIEIRQEDGRTVRYIIEPTVHKEIQTFIPVGDVK